MAHTERKQAHERKREWAVGFVAHGNDLVAAQDEPEPGERELPAVTEGERQVAQELQAMATGLPRRSGTYLEAPRHVTPEQAAAAQAFRQQQEERLRAFFARQQADAGYARFSTTCSLCGSPSNSQVCGHCCKTMGTTL
jgi:hypothetical protein